MTAAGDQAPSGGPLDGLHRYADLVSELTRATWSTTERLLAQFVRQGEVAAEHAERLLDEVVARSVEGSGALAHLVRTEVEHAVERAGYVRADEVEALRREVAALRARLVAHNGERTAAPVAAEPDAAQARPGGAAHPGSTEAQSTEAQDE